MTDSGSSSYTEEASGFSGNDSIISALTDANVCGEGATCRVYQMNLQGLHVAVKRLRRDYLGDPTHRAAYRKEFGIGRRLKHDALPTYREFRDDIEEVHIVMDFIDGVSLSGFIASEEGRRYFSSAENVRRFLSELVGVTGYLHRKGVIHCDIKPENIMLRHSDRGLMLIDLDKAYSDILNTTSGGTSGFSDLLKAGEKPTVRKDFVAIGKVLDHIAEKASRFPTRRFSHFREECDNPDATIDLLNDSLRRRTDNRLRTGIILFGLCAMTGIGYYAFIRPLSVEESEVHEVIGSDKVSADTLTPSVSLVPVAENNGNTTEPSVIPQSSRQITINDFDEKMADVIRDIQISLSALSAGTLSDSQIRTSVLSLSDTYHSSYHALLAGYKSEYPEVPGIDVELAVAKASEKSKAIRLLEELTRAARDTIMTRHPESYSAE